MTFFVTLPDELLRSFTVYRWSSGGWVQFENDSKYSVVCFGSRSGMRRYELQIDPWGRIGFLDAYRTLCVMRVLPCRRVLRSIPCRPFATWLPRPTWRRSCRDRSARSSGGGIDPGAPPATSANAVDCLDQQPASGCFSRNEGCGGDHIGRSKIGCECSGCPGPQIGRRCIRSVFFRKQTLR